MNDDLLVKYLLGEASPDEQQAVKEWIAGQEVNRLYFEQFRLIWDTSKQLAALSTIDEEAAWQRFRRRTANGNTRPPLVKKTGWSWWRIAAAVFLVAAGAGLLSYLFFSNTMPPQQLAQANEAVVKDTLPDGSMVTLNKHSSLSYPGKFKGHTRKVQLQGEAFFAVTPDKTKPFIIAVNDVEVTVVGTSFNIKSSNGSTEVIVETGIVRVTKNGNTTELHPGEKTTVTAATGIPVKEQVTDKLYNYYRTREFVCDNTPLSKVAEVISDAYNVHITFARPELRNLVLDSPFYNESLDQVLRVIELSFPEHNLAIVRKGNEIIFQ